MTVHCVGRKLERQLSRRASDSNEGVHDGGATGYSRPGATIHCCDRIELKAVIGGR